MKKYCLIVLLLLSATSYSQSLDFLNHSINGRVEFLENVWIQNVKDPWITWQKLSSRVDFRWYPSDEISAHIGWRNMLHYGTLVSITPGYADLLNQDEGYFDLTFDVDKASSYALISNFDRFNFKYSSGNFGMQIGRQRINWGVNLVWTPNDIFNIFSIYEFDYIERPGCDAVRLEYFTGFASSMEFAWKIDKDEKVTWAGMYRFNELEYDFQVIGGMMKDDVVLGGAWSGYISDAGFNGEFSYFHPKNNFEDEQGILVFSAGGNYMFENGIYVHGAMLFNSNGTTEKAGMGSMFAAQDISAKNLTRAKYSIYGESYYMLTPLIKLQCAGILNPSDNSYYISPSVDISVSNDVQLLLIGQLFYGNDGTEFGDYGKLVFGQLKWNF